VVDDDSGGWVPMGEYQRTSRWTSASFSSFTAILREAERTNRLCGAPSRWLIERIFGLAGTMPALEQDYEELTQIGEALSK